jgi:hypothetical protein
VAFLSVLNDSGAARSYSRPIWQKIAGTLSPIQLRELAAEFAFVNLNLKERPRYRSETNSDGTLTMYASVPDKVELEDPRKAEHRTVMYGCCKDILSKIGNADKESLIDLVKQGRVSFLFNSEGHFNDNSMEPIPSPSEK